VSLVYYSRQWRHHFESGRAADKCASGAEKTDLNLALRSPLWAHLPLWAPSPSWAPLPARCPFAFVSTFHTCKGPLTTTWALSPRDSPFGRRLQGWSAPAL